ncbi:hypothetical protein Lal_00005823 [Lupinus albus]|nr:hypothetical protein Lal_00005823 [Lupinus albus]
MQMMDDVESGILPRANIGITNKLQNLDLVFHCKDKVRDDGFRALSPNQRYKFGFTLDILLNHTLWYCRFGWLDEIHYFDIYSQQRDRCKTCEWFIHPNGPCRFVTETETDICYTWNDKGPPLTLKPLHSLGRN